MKITWSETGFVKTILRLIKQYPVYFFSMVVFPFITSWIFSIARHKIFVLFMWPPLNPNYIEDSNIPWRLSPMHYIPTNPHAYMQILPSFLWILSALVCVLFLWVFLRKKSDFRKMAVTTLLANGIAMVSFLFIFGTLWGLYYLFGYTAIFEFYDMANYSLSYTLPTYTHIISLLAYYLLFYYRSKTMLYGKKKRNII